MRAIVRQGHRAVARLRRRARRTTAEAARRAAAVAAAVALAVAKAGRAARPNVLLLLIDPISRAHFHRALPRTAALLRRSFVRFDNYSVVGARRAKGRPAAKARLHISHHLPTARPRIVRPRRCKQRAQPGGTLFWAHAARP